MRREEGVSRATSGSQEAKEVAKIEDLGAVHTMWKKDHASDESWGSASQSLGGFEEYDDSAYCGGVDDHHETEDDPVLEAYAAMVEQGLDEEDGEAVDWAADVLQAESEVYFARQGAKGGGHKGFGI